MTLFWRLLAIIGGTLLLLLIAVAIAVHTVDVRNLIGPIQKEIKVATGRDLTIRGAIDLKLSLEPKVVIEDVAFGNAPWGKAEHMLTAKRVEAQVALLPLLRRDFQLRSFTLIEPTIALETDAKGTGNWEFQGPTQTPSGPARASTALGGLFVGDLAISNGSLTYRDGESGKVTKVDIETLALNARDAQSPVSARFRGTVDDIAVAVEGDLGPLVLLAQRRWPYPVSLKGQVNSQDASVSTKVRVDDSTASLDPLDIAAGKSRLSGRLQITTGKPRPSVKFNFNAPALALADLPFAPRAPHPSTAKAAPPSRYVFRDDALDFSGLRAIDASGEFALDALSLAGGQRLEHVRVQLRVQNGVLDVPLMHADGLGGALAAQLRLDASRETDPSLALKIDAKNLDLAAVLAAFDVKREVHGGKTSVNADLAARGSSPRRWAASANGSFTAIVGPASLGHPKGDADSAFNRLADAVNPFRKVDAATELHCAVVRLPLRDGIANIDRSIAIETDKLGATASGTLDFRNETLDLAIKPQLRQGITINVADLAQLVRFRGPFTSPSVAIDAAATAATVARIGAAVSTGGASLLGEALLPHAAADSGAPCQVALGHATPAAAAGGKGSTPPNGPADDIGRALNKLLGR